MQQKKLKCNLQDEIVFHEEQINHHQEAIERHKKQIGKMESPNKKNLNVNLRCTFCRTSLVMWKIVFFAYVSTFVSFFLFALVDKIPMKCSGEINHWNLKNKAHTFLYIFRIGSIATLYLLYYQASVNYLSVFFSLRNKFMIFRTILVLITIFV